MTGLDAFLNELAEKVADKLAARMGASASLPNSYTTNKRGPHCPGKSRLWMLRHIKGIPGAKKVGKDWVIASADFDQWCTAEDASRVQRGTTPKGGDVESLAASYLESAGFRASRKVS